MKEKIKILWISTVAPCSKSPAAGGQTFNFYFKVFCQDDDFEVRLIALGDEKLREKVEEENKHITHNIVYPGMKINDWRKIYNLESKINPFTRYANMLSNYCASKIIKVAKEYAIKGYEPDVVILEWTNALVLASDIHKIFPKSKLIASEHDVAFVGLKRKSEYYKGLKALFWLQRYKWEKKVELKSLGLCDLILPHNFDNCDLLINEGIEKRNIQWLVPYFHNMNTINRKENNCDILFFGAMARQENYLSAIWFIENVMPLLSNQKVRFVILGSNPDESLKKYECEKIHITGFVESIEPYFESSLCFVAPLVLGAGIKVKVLEALSSGIPVLTNSIGIEGIPARSNVEYIYCETAEDYAKNIEMIISGKINVANLERNARNFVEENYSLQASLDAYKNSILEMVNIQ